MDLGVIAEQHGPLVAIVLGVLLFVQRLFAGGIKITVTHDPEQMKQLNESVSAAAGQADRLAVVESTQDKHAEELAAARERLTHVEVTVAERTKKRTTSSAHNPVIRDAKA